MNAAVARPLVDSPARPIASAAASSGAPTGTDAPAQVRELRAQLANAHQDLARAHAELAATRAVSAPAPVAPRLVPLLRVCDVAALLRVNVRTVRQWRTDRVLPPCVAIEGVVRWREADIVEWIASRVEVRP